MFQSSDFSLSATLPSHHRLKMSQCTKLRLFQKNVHNDLVFEMSIQTKCFLIDFPIYLSNFFYRKHPRIFFRNMGTD